VEPTQSGYLAALIFNFLLSGWFITPIWVCNPTFFVFMRNGVFKVVDFSFLKVNIKIIPSNNEMYLFD